MMRKPSAAQIEPRAALAWISAPWARVLVPEATASPKAQVAIAMACVIAGALARLPLQPLLGSTIAFVTFFPATLCATLMGGWRSGVAVALISGPLAQWISGSYKAESMPFELAVWLVMSAVIILAGHVSARIVNALRGEWSRLQRLEQDLRLITDELNHRVKNTLAVVQALAHQTLNSEQCIAFEGRLRALATAHDILTKQRWESVELRDLVARSFGAVDTDRWAAIGPKLPVPPRTAVAFSMALHELVTNAFKYGALSTAEGRVVLLWEADTRAQRLRLKWMEYGGPSIVAPSKTGFGMRMIQQALAADLKGDVRVTYPATGLVCEIDAPLSFAA